MSLNQWLNKFKALFKDNEIMLNFNKDVFELIIEKEENQGIGNLNNIKTIEFKDKYVETDIINRLLRVDLSELK